MAVNATFQGEIWQVVDSRGFGGIESHIYQLSLALKQQHQKLRVVLLRDYGDHPLKQSLDTANIPYIHLSHPYLGWNDAIRCFQPGLIHTHGYKAGIIGRIAAYQHHIACISTYHSGDANSWKLKTYRYLDERSAQLANRTISVSEEVARRIKGSTSLIENFVSVPTICNSQGKQIAFVGRLSHEKGPDSFIELAKQFPHQHFTIYGDGPMRKTIQLPSHVEMMGHVSSMTPYWKEIDLLVMPSRYEGLPMAALEAMAHGVPVLAFAVGGLPTLITYGVNGWTEEPGDINALCYTFQQWITMDAQQQQVIRQHAHEHIIAHYSPDAILPKIITLYEEAYAYRLHSR